MEKDSLIKIYTGDEITVNRIKAELENQGISALVQNGFSQGLAAGFSGGIPSAIDLYVAESDFEKSIKIVDSIFES
jgi:hypothetical protein